jgi:Trypsin-co-occurring domain 1
MQTDVVVRRAKVATDQVILVETRSSGDREEDVGARDLLAFEGVEESITTISQRVVAALKSAHPDRASVEFGIDVAVEAGALTGLLAKGSGGATLKVTLSWGGGG